MSTGVSWGNLRERDLMADPCVDGGMILRWNFRKWDGDVKWIDLAQDRDSYRVLVNAIMNFRIPQNAGNLLTS